jgi:hypothetical protein
MHSTIDLTVRVGSNPLKITVSRLVAITWCDVLALALNKCKLQNNSSMYALWEIANGVERMLNLNERLMVAPGTQLVVRKYRPSELRLLRDLNNHRSRVVARYYQRLERTQQPATNNKQKPPQQEPPQEPLKMCAFHQNNIAKRLNQQHVGFLHYLYAKLKWNKYDLLVNDQSSLVNEVATDSCGTSRCTSRSDSGSSIGLLAELESTV